MKLTISLLIVVTALLAASCDVFDASPESNFTPDAFYRNADDAKSAVSAVYDLLLSQNLYNQAMWILMDQSTDDAEWGGGRSTVNQAKNDIDKYTFTPSTTTFYTVWSTCYQGINRANAAIGRIPAIDMDAELRDRLVAEAKFLRGFYYFTLVRLFGGVPLVLQETESLNNLQVARASVDEVYAQIAQDFTDAETVLPLAYTGADIGRATKGAAKAFLTKMYLTRGDWPNASSKAYEVMTLGAGYDLWSSFSDVFLIANKNGKETIFEIQALGGGFGEGSYMQGYMRPSFDRVNGISGFGDDPVTKNLYEAYRSNDLRRDVTLKLYTSTGTPAAPASITFPCYVGKYKDPTATSNSEGSNNYPLVRYADILLMYAEALNEQTAGDPDAYDAINKVRNRAGLADLTEGLTQDQFRDSLLLERRLELAFEGHRWYDLVRTNKLIQALNAQNPAIPVAARHYLYPIPQTERDVNPLLGQNDY